MKRTTATATPTKKRNRLKEDVEVDVNDVIPKLDLSTYESKENKRRRRTFFRERKWHSQAGDVLSFAKYETILWRCGKYLI